jgi:L-ribulose-5-phosphate 4-epimerase
MNNEYLRKELIEYAKRLTDSGWVVGTSGNISARDEEDGSILLTPSGVKYNELKPEDLFLIKPDGQIIPGKGKPTSSMEFHLSIMKARPDCNVILHTHAVFATAASAITKTVPTVTLPSVLKLGGPISVSAYAENGSKEEAKNIVTALGDKGWGVIMQNHGAVSLGKDFEDAWLNMGYIEECSRVWIYCLSTGIKPSTIEKDTNNKNNCLV